MPPQASARLEFAAKTLRATHLFGAMQDDDLLELARGAKAFSAEQGKPVKPPGVSRREIIVVQSGVVAELLSLRENGRHALIALLGRNDVAGLTHMARRAGDPETPAPVLESLVALTNVSAFSITHTDISRMLRRDAELGEALWAEMALHANLVGERLAQNIYRPLETRLAALFSKITELSSANDWNPVVPIGHIAQSLLADMLGVSREHINRTLTMWERSGLIFQSRNGVISVQNRKRLAGLARYERQHSQPAVSDDWLWEIDAHLDCGLNQLAFHLAMEAAKRTPKDARIRHRAVLATARSGALSKALEQFTEFKLDKESSDEDIACLQARLLRDLAYLETPDAPDQDKLERSAIGYRKAYENSRGYYSGVTAAAGFALLGDARQAKQLALEVADLITQKNNAEDANPATYFTQASLGECALIAGDLKKAAAYFRAAGNCDDMTAGKKATTRKQLKRLMATSKASPDWMDEVAPQAKTLFFAGPLATRDTDQTVQFNNLLTALDDFLKVHPVEWAYGALASGADIVIAEALLARGVDLNIYLPLPPEEFLKHSVAISGGDWRARFLSCMRHVSNVEWNAFASKPEHGAYELGALIAIGKAVSHANQLETSAVGFFALPENRTAQNSISVANADAWKNLGLPFAAIRDAWSKTSARTSCEGAGETHYALTLENTKTGAAAITSFKHMTVQLEDPKSLRRICLFPTAKDALDAARRFQKSDREKSWRLWLDAGICAPASQKALSVENISDNFVTTLCLPTTLPGEIYASDPFVNVVTASGPPRYRFEYTGFAAVREKRAPCPLYLLC